MNINQVKSFKKRMKMDLDDWTHKVAGQTLLYNTK